MIDARVGDLDMDVAFRRMLLALEVSFSFEVTKEASLLFGRLSFRSPDESPPPPARGSVRALVPCGPDRRDATLLWVVLLSVPPRRPSVPIFAPLPLMFQEIALRTRT